MANSIDADITHADPKVNTTRRFIQGNNWGCVRYDGMHQKKAPLNASSNIYISFWYKYNKVSQFWHCLEGQGTRSLYKWELRDRWRCKNEERRGPEGKQSAATIRPDVFGSGAADRSVAAAYFTRLSQSFIAFGPVHTPREWLLCPGWISLFDLFCSFPPAFTDLNISEGINVCVCVCNPITLHFSWCVAYTGLVHTRNPLLTLTDTHTHTHIYIFPLLDLLAPFRNTINHQTCITNPKTVKFAQVTTHKTHERNTIWDKGGKKANGLQHFYLLFAFNWFRTWLQWILSLKINSKYQILLYFP